MPVQCGETWEFDEHKEILDQFESIWSWVLYQKMYFNSVKPVQLMCWHLDCTNWRGFHCTDHWSMIWQSLIIGCNLNVASVCAIRSSDAPELESQMLVWGATDFIFRRNSPSNTISGGPKQPCTASCWIQAKCRKNENKTGCHYPTMRQVPGRLQFITPHIKHDHTFLLAANMTIDYILLWNHERRVLSSGQIRSALKDFTIIELQETK